MAVPQFSLAAFWLRVRFVTESYWFWPLVLGVAGVLLALAMLAFERATAFSQVFESHPWLTIDNQSARTVLSVIAGAMITATSIVYSLSLLIRTIAIGTLGPRLIESYDKVRINRFTLGVQLLAFLYALTVLYAVGQVVDRRTFTVALAIIIAVVALVYLVAFVNTIARQVRIDQTIADVAGELRRRLRADRREFADGRELPPPSGGTTLASPVSGYVHVIDRARACEIARAADCRVVYEVRAGDFVVAGRPLLCVLGDPDDESRQGLIATVTLGPHRIDAEDLRFQCLLLVEIALRALSPGINDVFTAVACADHLAGILAEIGGRDVTPKVLRDELGMPRVYGRPLTYQDLVDAVFHPLRQSGAGIPTMAICLLRRLADIIAVTEVTPARAHLLRHAELIADAAIAKVDANADRAAYSALLKDIHHHAAAGTAH